MDQPDLFPTKCNLCGGEVHFISNSQIYGKEYGSGKCYCCSECKAYVGTHRPRPKEALGLLSDFRMREGRKVCHALFDAKWKLVKNKRIKKRKDLYFWLSKELTIPVSMCHFGYFDLVMLKKAYRILITIKDKPIKYDKQGNIYFD